MTSNIDPTQPPTGYATTAGQRANWQTAHDEITALQSGAAQPSNALPAMDGTAIGGASVLYARGDHVHPTDTSLAPIASPTFTGTVTLPGDPTIPLGAVTKQYS